MLDLAMRYPPKYGLIQDWFMHTEDTSLVFRYTRHCKTSACHVRHLKQDFDTGTRLSGICLYAKVVLMRLQTLYPIAPFSILA